MVVLKIEAVTVSEAQHLVSETHEESVAPEHDEPSVLLVFWQKVWYEVVRLFELFL